MEDDLRKQIRAAHSRTRNKQVALTTNRLRRLSLSDPAAVVSAHRKARGRFWAAAAMGRHTHRMAVASRSPELLPSQGISHLLHVPRADAILQQYGIVWSLSPDGWILDEAEWPSHLQWGADRYVELVRHLAAGRSLAAAAIARSQLERWSINLASTHGIETEEGERTRDWISRVWRTYPRISEDMGAAWAELSEFLHGRGQHTLAQEWERCAGNLAKYKPPVKTATSSTHERIAQVAGLTFTQVRGGIGTLASTNGHEEWAQLMQNEFSVSEVKRLTLPLELCSHPLDPVLAFGDWVSKNEPVARGYRIAMDLAAKQDRVAIIESGAVMGALVERRIRAVHRFRQAWASERRELGDAFDPGSLLARLFRYIAISEAAEIVSLWAPEPEGVGLRMAGGALRSAFHLWLEDTDLALTCIRVTLEQTCVARGWRLRPGRAQRLVEKPGIATPSRWIDVSGWRRAAVLGRALGEFSHVSLRSRTHGARQLLADLQADDVENKGATARGHALDATAYLLAFEVIDRLEAVDADLADGFRKEVTLMSHEDHNNMLDDLLKRSQVLRDYDFGLPDFDT